MFAFARKPRPSSAHSPAPKAPSARPVVGRADSDAGVRTLLSPPAPSSRFDFASIPVMPPRTERKLTISSPENPFERQADAVADEVMRPGQRALVGAELRRANAEGGTSRALAPPVVHDVLARPGRPLEPAARHAMEGRFGADFSSVRVHDDARAAESALAVGAHAYTVGSDVVFAAGRYGPGTTAGDRLLAHELAHTLQGGATTLHRQPRDKPTVWDTFATDFNNEFKDVLNAFSTPAAPLTAGKLRALFTDTQRKKLQEFMTPPHRIPERLFNSTDKGTTTAQQRLLLSAHILAKGIYKPGSFEQRVHAQYCFHWVQIVHHYAGATPPRAGFAGGVMGTFDPLGAAVITTGKDIDIANPTRVSRPDLPAEESPAAPQSCGPGQQQSPDPAQPPPACGLGPLHEGTKQAEAAQKAEEADPGKGSRYYRQPHLPFEKFTDFQTGDWLYLYNANASEGGGHSVIFSHWQDAEIRVHAATGARFRIAIVWSQPRPDRGGVQHPTKLGDRFVPNPANNLDPFVTPVTFVSRVSPETAPATTAAEMLPGPTGAVATALAKANEDFIKGKKLKGPVNRNRLKTWLRDKNESFMLSLGTHLDPGQRDVLRKVNVSDDLEALVRLYQRLRPMSANAKLLDEQTSAYYKKLDPTYKAAKEKKDVATAGAAKELRAAEARLKSVETDPRVDDQEIVRELERAAADEQRAISRLPAGDERDDATMRRDRYLSRAAAARDVQRRRAELRAGRDKALKARDAEEAVKLPFGVVHPGDLRKEDRRRAISGRLADINADIEWDKLVDPPAPTTPPTATPKKP
jgi:hypothetical protein